MAKRTFSELKKIMALKQFNSFCKRVAMDYAYSDLSKATTYFTDEYNITVSCYNRVKDYAVTHFLVSDYTIDCMERKAIENQRRSSISTGRSSNTHYQKLRAKRKEYILQLAKEYIEHPELSLSELIEKRGREAQDYYSMLGEAFIGDYGVTFEMAKKMIARMFTDCPSPDKSVILCSLVERLWEERNAR